MADLTNVLGGPWSPKEAPTKTPEQQFIDSLLSAGIDPPESIIFDGRIHRFRSGTKGKGGHGDKTGWYIIFPDGIPAGRFGCWRSGVEHTFRADIGRTLSRDEESAYMRRLAEAVAAREAELKKSRQIAAETVSQIWENGLAAEPAHPYLTRKGIKPHGARVTGDGRIMLPLHDNEGNLTSLQYIASDGTKLYHPGGKTGGSYWWIGDITTDGIVYIAEGFATAATIHEATGRPCVVAYSASNLIPVTGHLRESLGNAREIIIVADNDASGTGKNYADQASAKHGATVIIPPIEGMDANDYAQSGHDLAALLSPPIEQSWLIPADEFSSMPAPISWLIKGWLQSSALIMVHGPSGGGKTFVVLDWCLRMASGMEEWFGHRVRGGNVVYLAGEGHHGLRGRVAAWKHHHQAGGLSMWLSRDGCDLNTPQGYSRIANSIRQGDISPKIIVVDTLHRFLHGDENSAQDAKTMLDACNGFIKEFDCSVVLVHHTGVSEEAQHRARGSSAWRGALDIEISVIPATENMPMQIVQRKSKDAELSKPVLCSLQSIEIPGWLDEDGQQVTSAIITEEAAPAPAKVDSKLAGHRKIFEAAWWAAGAEERMEKPYVSRSAMIDYLRSSMGLSEASAQKYIKPGASGKPIAELLIAQIITSFEHGWIISDSVQATAMMMQKEG